MKVFANKAAINWLILNTHTIVREVKINGHSIIKVFARAGLLFAVLSFGIMLYLLIQNY